MATVVTNIGKGTIAGRIKPVASGNGLNEPRNVAMGTGSTTAVVADRALNVEVETRTAGTSSQVTTSQTGDTYQVVGTITATATRGIVESGLFDVVTTTLLNEAGGINLASVPATINVDSTTGFASTGVFYLTNGTAWSEITYGGTSGGNQFTSCSRTAGASTGTAADNTVVGQGYILTHGDFAVINLSTSDSIQFTWKVQIT